ncbi:hypothetical protein H5410_024709 [Solanum commersonii]|uniref:Uncharacterized protein n=1 Tax=Solanum commersonii TaxID=4109 RepID=A0A9J5ZMT6_SOLCO|nr:hypothetical protein H5410_024709 [Solanum commersonii]
MRKSFMTQFLPMVRGCGLGHHIDGSRILSQLVGAETAQIAWNKLVATYASGSKPQIRELKTQLHTLQRNNTTYQPFTRSLESRQADISFDALYGLLLNEERQLKRDETLNVITPTTLYTQSSYLRGRGRSRGNRGHGRFQNHGFSQMPQQCDFQNTTQSSNIPSPTFDMSTIICHNYEGKGHIARDALVHMKLTNPPTDPLTLQISLCPTIPLSPSNFPPNPSQTTLPNKSRSDQSLTLPITELPVFQPSQLPDVVVQPPSSMESRKDDNSKDCEEIVHAYDNFNDREEIVHAYDNSKNREKNFCRFVLRTIVLVLTLAISAGIPEVDNFKDREEIVHAYDNFKDCEEIVHAYDNFKDDNISFFAKSE